MKLRDLQLAAAAAAALAAAAACGQADGTRLRGLGEGVDEATSAEEAPAPLCVSTGRPHVGLGKIDLTAGRATVVAGSDRGRMKPYSALVTEYARVLGPENAPELIAASGDTFGRPAPRNFAEPEPNAVSLYTAFRVGFEGCLRLTGAVPNASGAVAADPRYAAPPTAATASAECARWARRFWSREASPDEIAECVAVATTDALKEEQTNGSAPLDATPQRRWAYACATVLGATGFLAY